MSSSPPLDLSAEYLHLRQTLSPSSPSSSSPPDIPITPTPSSIATARAALSRTTSSTSPTSPPLGAAATLAHIRTDLVPALCASNRSGRYYGFVIGSSLPVAEAADNVVSALDQMVALHLDSHSLAAEIEGHALELLARLLGLDSESLKSDNSDAGFTGRILTTGATASNILGLTCARESLLDNLLAHRQPTTTVSEMGFLAAAHEAGIVGVRILATMPHSSMVKAASVVGLGTRSFVDVSAGGAPWRMDLDAVERELARAKRDRMVSIVVVGAGEVNTGGFATRGWEDMKRLRRMVDEYSGWIHVDGAFGIFARILPPTPAFSTLRTSSSGLELADSITIDCHKVLNVPYDCGAFFTRHAHAQRRAFSNGSPAYLSTSSSSSSSSGDVVDPLAFLNLGIENSRRFRALPVYAALVSEGKAGIAEMHTRMVCLARRVAAWIEAHDKFELLGRDTEDHGRVQNTEDHQDMHDIHIIVLFRHVDPEPNKTLVARINETKKMFVSGTAWDGRPAVRLAVSSWRVDGDEDFAVITTVLDEVAVVGK